MIITEPSGLVQIHRHLAGTIFLDALDTHGSSRLSLVLHLLTSDWQPLVDKLRAYKLGVLSWGWLSVLDKPHGDDDESGPGCCFRCRTDSADGES